MRKLAICLAAASAFMATPALAATNLVANGSFEEGTNPGVFTTVYATDSTTIDGWEVTGGSIDYIGSYWDAEDGDRSIDLAGYYQDGVISQMLTTVIGQAYQLTFWISANPDGGTDPRTGFVDYNGTPTVFTYLGSGNTASNMQWQQVTYNFVATTTQTLLAFASDPATSGGGAFGPALDNVWVVATPEPATWLMLILGFGIAGSSIRGRRRKAILA